MATLIQSKQIEGVVTASVIHGEFLVSGSLVVTGSQSVLGAVTASSISSSFSGDGSGITNITYSQIENTPQFVGGNNITITSSSNVITVHAQLDGTGSDAQSLSISGDQLTILGGNTITIPTGSGVSDYTQLTNVPSGIISGSSQITITQSQISDLSHTDISSLNTFSASIQSEVDSLTAATSSYLTQVPAGTISGSEQLPAGLISGSSQITITQSQISDLSHYSDSDVKIKLDTEGVLSGSLVSQLPSGLISGSTFTDYSSSIKTELSDVRTDLITQFTNNDNALESKITNIQSFTSSIQSEVDSLTSATSSYLTTVPSGTISGSEQLPQGLISGSSQITITESQISDLSHYTNSDVQSYIDSIGVVSGSVIAELPSGVISGSSQITISSSQISDLAHTQIPSGTISGSEQLPSGLISGSITDQLPSGVISGSSQITITESQISDLSHTDISNLNTFTSSIQTQVDGLSAATSSYLTSIDSGIISSSAQVTDLLPSGIISGSLQLPSGIISGSSQITITESQISDLTHYTDSDVKTKLDVEGVISGSTQITDGSGIVSSSVQVISHLPSGVISGSLGTLVSSSVNLLTEVSGANYEVSGANYLESKSVDSRLDAIEGSFGNYYDVSNTVWNNKYIRPGSEHFSDSSTWNINEGVNLFTFTLNNDRTLHYDEGKILFIKNFDGDVRLSVTPVTGSDGVYYNTGSREVTFRVLEINGETTSSNITRINDSYWILSRHTAGFVDSASYVETSASIDDQFKAIANAGAGADWDVNLFNIPSGIISSSQQLYSPSVEAGLATTASLNEVSSSLNTKIENVFLSSSNFDNKTLVSGSSQIDLRSTTNYVADEHIDHTTVTISTGDGLVGGGDIASSRTISLNNTSSYFQAGVQRVLDEYGFPLSTTYTTDSASFDIRINSISAGLTPAGTVSGSSQIDITQTQNYTTFSSSIATSIAGASGASSWGELSGIPSGLVSSSIQVLGGTDILSGSHPIGNLNTFTESVQSQVDALIAATSSFLTSETDSQTLSIVGDQLSISSGNTITIPTGSGVSDFTQLTNVPSGLVSSSEQVLGGSGITSGSVLTTLDGTGVLSASVDFATYSSSVATTIDNIVHTQIPAGTISGSSQVTELLPAGVISGSTQLPSGIFSGSFIGQGNVTITSGSGYVIISGSGGSGGSSDVSYDGNRVISNEDLGDLFTNSVNPGTSGSIQDFLNAVFYPNTAPSISTGNQTIEEYRTNGSTIVTLSGTDPEGQSITWGTGSSYTDDLVRVSSVGVMTLNALPTSASFNTSVVGGGHGHLVKVTATDSFGTSTEKDIYIIVTPNAAPIFRETSISGNEITSVTSNLNENSTNGTLVKRVYFTDAESDAITIYSSSVDNNHFAITKYSTYVDITQNTSSLDYEQQTQYTFSISASDEHYVSGEDLDSITYLPITVNVTDNLTPTVSDQTLSSINENSSNGATVGSISAADNESDTITFKNFALHQLQLDGVVVSSGSYSGTSQLTDPHEEPFQMSTGGVVTRKTGVYLNSDLINKYIYRVQVTDNFNGDSNVALVTINITDDTPATLSDNWSAGPYIKESELSGTTIKTTNYGSTTADYNSNQSGTWSSSNSAISINSNGNLSLNVDLSGSVTQSGDTLDSTITFTNTFGTTTTDNLSVTIVGNSAPTATFTDQSSNFNTNLATTGTNLVSVTISDVEGDTPYSMSLSGTGAWAISAVPQNSNSSSYQIQVTPDTASLAAGSYSYDVNVTDNYGESTTYSGRSFTIAQAGSGTMTENGTFYIIESATSGDLIRINSSGRTGTQGGVVVSYSPNYGSQSATSFASSNPLISINSSTGVLSVGTDISGSGNTNGSIIASTITWTDQYGNNGSDTIAVNVTKNNAPTVSSTQTFNENTNQATGSSEIVRLNLTDTEGDSILSSGLSWTNYNTTYFTPSNSTGIMKLLVNSTSVPAGTYDYTASIEDVHGFETRLHSGSVTISQADDGTLGGDTSIYIIESAENTDVFRDATGYNQGNAAQVSVSYSPSYGSPVVTEFTSSRQGISVDSSGNLTAGYDFSGSVTSTDYTSTALASDSTNSTLYGKSLHVNGIKVVQGAAVGGQSAVPDAFTEKVAQMIKLMVTSSGVDINDTDQANMIGILKGETGTWHSGYPTAQRILRGAGSDYSPNPLIDSNYSSYSGLQNFQDSHATDDMVWYLNSSAASGSGDNDAQEVIEHIFHTIHQYGVRGAVSGSFNGLSWDPETDSNWNTRELYYAIKEAVDDNVFDISGYGDASYNTAATFKLIAKEYLYLLNFNMWEYSSLWSGGSLSPEWNDNSRTPSGIQTNNPLGYALYNKYIKPVLTKPSLSTIRSIFQDGDVGDPTIAGSSGYTPEVGTGLISKITFRDQYGNVGSGSVTATVFGNSAPSATFTAASFNTDEAISGSNIGSLTVTDTENNSPFTITLAGTDGGKFDVSGSSSPFTIQPTGSLAEGSYSINITVTDTYGESITLTNESITVEAAEVLTTVYIYRSGYGSDAGFSANYNAVMGAATLNTDVPPQVTSYTANTSSPYYKFKSGDIGSSTITLAGGATATLAATVSGSSLNAAVSESADSISWASAQQTIILIPSGSSMSGVPTSMTDGTGGSTAGEYVLVEYADGTSAPLGATPSVIHSIVLDSSKDGYIEWFVIGAKQQNNASSMRLKVLSSSGSISDF